ncbi:MAG: PDDEXK nuclease domain-containing protein [Achromobacter sp.]|uniref:PDDEXK nuclease domain-containing protein n=1 Tax=unclassified Achromobacter TaxID=2626865 RepID=UPI0013C475E2|nr:MULTISPECIES: PDDEXK nuclease domain-containing protein [unclassified Achromobacter]MDX3985791.1 PDDEXK nuclease domain-containing protein [Achromobacter sp.]QYJ23589.1 DUF1016 domain-containing protein [Achromobacter sp. ES-001]
MTKWNLGESGSRAGRAMPADAAPARALHMAIVADMESFLMQLDVGLAFVARQKRLRIDNDDHTLDLLFFHRKLRRLVALVMTLDESCVISERQMESCLRWLDKSDRRAEEATPLGMILCAGTQTEYIQLLALTPSGVEAAQYPTDLPPRAVLAQRLQQAARRARARLEQRASQSSTMPS